MLYGGGSCRSVEGGMAVSARVKDGSGESKVVRGTSLTDRFYRVSY